MRDLLLVTLLLVGTAYAQDTSQIVATTDRAEICGIVNGKTYSQRHRYVSHATKVAVYVRAGIDPAQSSLLDSQGRPLWEVDHICPLEIGCSNDIKNLQLQYGLGPWNYHQKDALENEGKPWICQKGVDPTVVQGWFINVDWRIAYKAVFGEQVVE